MSTEIDYSDYSLDELLEAQATVNREAFPDRAQAIDNRIAQLTAGEPTESDDILREAQVKFTGKAGEFFSIWIVNLLLSIVTLGIYSAWAKVRTNRYFYGNTEIDGHRFSYLAEPLQILKGRIIAGILFGAYFITSSLYPVAGLVLILIIFALTPVFVVLGLRFNMKMTAYRNVRFGFKGNFGDAFVYFVLLPFASIFTAYLLMPFVFKKIDQFLVDEMQFGDKSFKSNLSTGTYYLASLGASAIGMVIMIGGIFSFGGLASFGEALEGQAGQSMALIGVMVLYLLVFAVSSSYYTAKVRNHLFANSEVGGVAKFESNMAFGGLTLLRITNLLAIIFSLGLAIPWVKIRNAKFHADATKVNILAGVDSVLAGNTGDTSAIAEEASTLFDVDVSLG